MAVYYTTFTEVQSEFKDITFTSTTNVSDADVTAFIEETDALIDSIISVRYATPVLNTTQGFTLLRGFCKAIVANKIKGILEVKNQIQKDQNQNVRTGLTTPEVLKMLKNLADGVIALPGVEPLASGFGSYNVDNSIEPVFKKETVQW